MYDQVTLKVNERWRYDMVRDSSKKRRNNSILSIVNNTQICSYKF